MSQLNESKLIELPFNSFDGGYSGAKGIGTLGANEARNVSNIIILPQGTGFKSRLGTKQVTPVGGSSHNLWSYVTSVLADREQVPGFDSSDRPLYVMTMAKETAQSGGSDVITCLLWKVSGSSSPALTSGGQIFFTGGTVTQDFRFSLFAFNSVHIITTKRGGTISGGNAMPLKTNSLSGATLTSLQTGVAPAGEVGIGWNNRAWIGNTSSNPSKLYYSALGTATDWNGTGSGFVEPSPGAADELTALSPISNNVLLYFKRNTIYQVVGRTDPFSVFEIFRGVGCVGPDAVVNVDGMVYFITPKGQMRITDGNKIYDEKDIPKLADADDLWQAVPEGRRYFIKGSRVKGTGFDHLVWLTSSAIGTPDIAIVWDLINKCWLKMANGYKGLCITSSPEGVGYIGSNDSCRIFELNAASWFADDPTGTVTFDGNGRLIVTPNASAITWLWRSDDFSIQMNDMVQTSKVNVHTTLSSTGTLSLTYRYDGLADSTPVTKSIVPTSTVMRIDSFRPLGRGLTFGLELGGSSQVTYQINKYSLIGHKQGTKSESKGVR